MTVWMNEWKNDESHERGENTMMRVSTLSSYINYDTIKV